MASYLEELAGRYPIVSVEDGLAEDDWDTWRLLTERLGDRVQLVGDDIFVTSLERLRRGIDGGVANAILVKVNQIGTLTESLDVIELAQRAATASSSRTARARPRTRRSRISPSRRMRARSRPGSPSRTDRVAKYNQLLRIEEELGAKALYPGWDAFAQRGA